jgi:hypothetical protein
MSEEEAETLMQHGKQLRRSRGLLHGIRTLPKRLLGNPSGGSGTPHARSEGGLGSHWVQFLTEDPEVKHEAAASTSANIRSENSGDLTELPVSVPSA